MKRVIFASLGLASLVACVACGARSAPPANVPPALEHIARVHKARCGTCHVRVEPGQRSREELETALARHHKRVRLGDADWAKLVDYLAADGQLGLASLGDRPASPASSTP